MAGVSRRSRLAQLLGAVLLGVATIFLPKTQPDQHWSEPPVIELVVDHDQATRSGDPPVPG
jgi:hypothetical protein